MEGDGAVENISWGIRWTTDISLIIFSDGGGKCCVFFFGGGGWKYIGRVNLMCLQLMDFFSGSLGVKGWDYYIYIYFVGGGGGSWKYINILCGISWSTVFGGGGGRESVVMFLFFWGGRMNLMCLLGVDFFIGDLGVMAWGFFWGGDEAIENISWGISWTTAMSLIFFLGGGGKVLWCFWLFFFWGGGVGEFDVVAGGWFFYWQSRDDDLSFFGGDGAVENILWGISWTTAMSLIIFLGGGSVVMFFSVFFIWGGGKYIGRVNLMCLQGVDFLLAI